MTENPWEQELAALLDRHVGGTTRVHKSFETADPPKFDDLLNIADLLWEAAHGAPPLAQDPVAAMLGLVPDSARTLSGKALKQALRASGLQVSALAKTLSDRGWEVATRDVFNWQTRDDASVPPALIQAIAEVTGTPAGNLTVDRGESPTHVALKSVTSSASFRALAERWSHLRGTTIDLGASALESRLAASVYRGGAPDEARLLASLEALITALESEAQRGNGN